MELGLHRRDVHCHLLRDEKQRTGISALIWSIVILDRQWSAATGLPQNFQESDFDQSIEPPVSHLVLKTQVRCCGCHKADSFADFRHDRRTPGTFER